MRNDKKRLQDILESIQLLEKHLSNNKELYKLNELEFMGVVRCIEVIGEACRYLSEGLKTKYPDIPWREISNMRNILAHQYFNVDIEKVEIAVKQDIPRLRIEIENIIRRIES